MARPSVTPLILEKLEHYLDARMHEWNQQSDDPKNRIPTLPTTKDGKVNVRAINECLNFPASYQQHFFNKPEIKDVVNEVCHSQCIRGIGSTVPDEDDDAARKKISQQGKVNKQLGEALAATSAELARLRESYRALRAIYDEMQSSGWLLREGPIKKNVRSSQNKKEGT